MEICSLRSNNWLKFLKCATDFLFKSSSHLKESPVSFKSFEFGKNSEEEIRCVSSFNKLYFVFFTVLLLGGFSAKAQTTTPTTGNSSSQQTNTSRTSTDSPPIGVSNSREVEGAFNDLNMLGVPRTVEASNRRLMNEIARSIYRKPGKNEMKALMPSAEHLNVYALFLRQSNTGIIKLNSDSGCAEDSGVITAKESCLEYSIPGGGTSYSFRAGSHRITRLSDLTLSKNVLKSDGILQHGILVKLGDVPIENVSLQTRGLQYLINFEPITDVESLANFDKQLIKGINNDGFTYSVGFYVRNQTTYALRSIAYKGTAMRSVKGISYNELDFDKRRDILVVFRVIEIEANGNITLVWKILSEKESPALKFQPTKNNR